MGIFLFDDDVRLFEIQVDMIVVCSTSDVLRKDILSKAGARVQTEFEVRSSSGEQTFSTSNGSLSCKKIFFLPWKVDQSDATALQPSVSNFVSKAIKYAMKNDHQSIGKSFFVQSTFLQLQYFQHFQVSVAENSVSILRILLNI